MGWGGCTPSSETDTLYCYVAPSVMQLHGLKVISIEYCDNICQTQIATANQSRSCIATLDHYRYRNWKPTPPSDAPFRMIYLYLIQTFLYFLYNHRAHVRIHKQTNKSPPNKFLKHSVENVYQIDLLGNCKFMFLSLHILTNL
jgi:hypothetical protein